MALAVDASSPARWSGTPGQDVDITSASFTPPTDSVLELTAQADTADATQNCTLSVSDSLGGTWVNKSERDPGDAGAEAGHASIWRRTELGTNASMTVSVRRTSAGAHGTNRISCKLYVVTGQDASPDGAVGEGTTTTNNTTPTLFTTQGANSYAFLSVSDWNQRGSPTSSDGIEDSADYSGAISVMSAYELQGAASSSANMNIDCGGTAAVKVNWAAHELKESAAGGRTTKNTRANPLGVNVGMGFRMGA